MTGSAEFVSPATVASRLRMHVETVYLYLAAGRIPGVKIGRLWRVPSSYLLGLHADAWDRTPRRAGPSDGLDLGERYGEGDGEW